MGGTSSLPVSSKSGARSAIGVIAMPALLFEVRNHIAYLTLNRPQVHNSLNPELIVQLAEAWKRVNEDGEIRTVIVTGAGDKAFSAGADLGRMIPLMTGARKAEDEWDEKLLANRKQGDHALLRHYDVDKPVIAAVNGFCIAGGFELMQATDLRVAAEHARFGLQEVKWAIIPAAGSLVRLPRQMPYCKAMEILLTGNLIDAREAHRLGLVNYVVPPSEVIAKAEEIASTIAANGPIAVRAIKQGVRRATGHTYEEGFKIENEVARPVMKSMDAREGPRAFMEKRKPVYRGR
jgi:enoyl-CoA hydratase